MLSAYKIIDAKMSTVEFMVMAMVHNAHSQECKSLLEDFLICEKIPIDLNMATKCEIDEFVVYEGVMRGHCKILGHEGYPGGEASKLILSAGFKIELEALNMMLTLFSEEIKEAEEMWLDTLNNND